MDTAIEFKHVKKVYGEKVIIDDFNRGKLHLAV